LLVTNCASSPGRHWSFGRMCSGSAAVFTHCSQPGQAILDAHVAQHLNFGRHIVELFTDVGADLGEYTTALALALRFREFMTDLNPCKCEASLARPGLPALIFSSRSGVALSSGSTPTASVSSSVASISLNSSTCPAATLQAFRGSGRRCWL